MVASKAMLTPGSTLFGRYEVLDHLGSGTMGTVYLCHNRAHPEDKLALKVLSNESGRSEVIETRFRNELHASYRISHPNVVRGKEFFRHESGLAFSMEYIEGGTLQDIIAQKRRLSWEQIVCVISQICSGLEAIHTAGIIHRDLKPHNILISTKGEVKISDFSAATFKNPPNGQKDNTLIGTIDYMSPEALHTGEADHRADLYGLGTLAYQLVTGQLPFKGENVYHEVNLKLCKNPIAPHIVNPQCPIGLSQLIMMALRRDPKKRFQSAAEMLHVLSMIGSTGDVSLGGDNIFGRVSDGISSLLGKIGPELQRPTAMVAAVLLLSVPVFAVSSPALRPREIRLPSTVKAELTIVELSKKEPTLNNQEKETSR